MGENFQAGVCGSTLWSSTRGTIGFSPCLVGVNHDYGSFGWPSHDLMEFKAISNSATRDVSNLIPNQGSFVSDQFLQKPSEAALIDSTLLMMDISRSSTKTTTPIDWNQNLISGSGSNETSYKSRMVQENMSSTLNYELKQTSSTQAFSIQPSLPMSSTSYSYPSTLIENLFDDDQLPLENQTMNFPSTTTYQTNLNEFSSSLMKLPSSLSPPSQPRQEIPPSHLIDSNHFWNGSSAAPNDRRASIFSSAQLVEKSNLQNLKRKSSNRAVHDSKKSSEEPAVKRSRIETPSTLPTFKVRKEKLGDRITALQQLVSPFGKTDTASVLQEAIEYIKFLHDQVNVLSTPFLKDGASIQHQENFDIQTKHKNPNQDLRGRGLCLVPISSTFPVTTETTVDFWTPTFGGTLR